MFSLSPPPPSLLMFCRYSFIFLHLSTELAAQLFLPASHLPAAALSISPKTSKDCAWSSKYGRQQQPLAATNLDKKQLLGQQLDEAKKVKALINLLNVRRKPAKMATKFEEMPSKSMALGADLGLMLRTIEQKFEGPLKVEENEIRKKKKKASANTGGKNKGKVEFRRAKRDNGPQGEEGNSVLEKPLNPPNSEGDGTATGRCNSERIRRTIKRAKGRDAAAIKRNIQTLAERQFDAKFNVICANADFSYISNTEEFCQEQINGNTCYVFRQLQRIPKFVAESEGGGEEEEEEEEEGEKEAGEEKEEEQFAQQFAALGRRGRKRKRGPN
uniref:Ground-like domain-containing protein n=1 Tax=Globodera rostochiensis TaxID=31243 RepID=A0A914HS04_GLORO